MKYQNPNIDSSYRQNDLGKTLYDLVLEKKPKRIVEVGALYGYSTIAMAMALDELGEGHINVYDLFDQYPHKHASLAQIQANLDRYGVSGYVTLHQESFEGWLAHREPFDMLHVDISNTGDTIDSLWDAFRNDIEHGATVIFEGGSPERDKVEWVTKYSKRPIGATRAPYRIIDARFPSLSMLG